MKKTVTILAAVAAAVVMIGCGGSVPVEDAPPGSSEDEGPDPEEENAEGGGEEGGGEEGGE